MSVMDRIRSLVVVDADHLLLKLSVALQNKPKAEQRQFFGGSRDRAGWFYLFADEALAPGVIFECVTSEYGDYVSSLYKHNYMLASIGELMKVRQEVVTAIAEKMGLSWDSIGIPDQARGRDLGLEELATGQLIDLYLEQMRGGIITQQVDNHGLDHIDKQVEAKSIFDGAEIGKSKIDEAGVLVMDGSGNATVKTLAELDK